MLLMNDHLSHCVAHAVAEGGDVADAKLKEASERHRPPRPFLTWEDPHDHHRHLLRHRHDLRALRQAAVNEELSALEGVSAVDDRAGSRRTFRRDGDQRRNPLDLDDVARPSTKPATSLPAPPDEHVAAKLGGFADPDGSSSSSSGLVARGDSRTAVRCDDVSSSVELEIGGMTCASCAARVEKKLNRMPGVEASASTTRPRRRVGQPARWGQRSTTPSPPSRTGYTASFPRRRTLNRRRGAEAEAPSTWSSSRCGSGCSSRPRSPCRSRCCR
jgi:hypothetical protein